MENEKPLILKNGKLSRLQEGELTVNDFYSGFGLIPSGEIYCIPSNRQSINFTTLTLDGTLKLDGDLWLA